MLQRPDPGLGEPELDRPRVEGARAERVRVSGRSSTLDPRQDVGRQ